MMRVPWVRRSRQSVRLPWQDPANNHANTRSRSMSSMDSNRLTLLALCAVKGASWHAIARAARRPEDLDALANGHSVERSTEAEKTAHLILAARDSLAEYIERAKREVEAAQARAGARLVTALDDDYPANLRLIYNPPPFLFVRGELRPDDPRSVAVVGTREASEAGLRSEERR